MSDRGLLLLDSDIFILHAGADLLPELVAAAGFDLSEARRLAALPHMLRKGRMSKRHPSGVVTKAQEWCTRIRSIDEVPSPHLVDLLAAMPGIDEGETYLFSLAAERRSIVATGDKRACVALATADRQIAEPLQGKIICLETALLLLLDQVGYATLAKGFTPAMAYNQTLRVLLSQGEQTPEEHFRGALASYYAAVERDVGTLLFDTGGPMAG